MPRISRDEELILDREEYWKVNQLNESAHILSYDFFISKPNIELNGKH